MRRRAAAIAGKHTGPIVRHFRGLPPELTSGTDERVLLPPPSFLIMEEAAPGVILLRLTDDGEVVGDTWHPSEQEATSQAQFEYGSSVGEWIDIPEGVSDVVDFMRDRTAATDKGRGGPPIPPGTA